MKPITLVGDAMRALAQRSVEQHMSYLADDIMVESCRSYVSTPTGGCVGELWSGAGRWERG
jgi:hypothetical protein